MDGMERVKSASGLVLAAVEYGHIYLYDTVAAAVFAPAARRLDLYPAGNGDSLILRYTAGVGGGYHFDTYGPPENTDIEKARRNRPLGDMAAMMESGAMVLFPPVIDGPITIGGRDLRLYPAGRDGLAAAGYHAEKGTWAFWGFAWCGDGVALNISSLSLDRDSWEYVGTRWRPHGL